MIGEVYTIGYGMPGAAQQIAAWMTQDKMLLIDTRKSPHARYDKQFEHAALQAKYCKRYRWAGNYLGNINYNNDKPIELVSPDPGIAALLSMLERGYSIILLCDCRFYERCHRSVIVALLSAAAPHIVIHSEESTPKIETVKCLSIQQPYAQWFFMEEEFRAAGIPPKFTENRDWSSKYTGPLLIHAGKKFDTTALPGWSQRFPALEDVVPTGKSGYTFGAIIGICSLSAVVKFSADPWFCGEYGFILRDFHAIEPIPYSGHLNLFDVPLSTVEHALQVKV